MELDSFTQISDRANAIQTRDAEIKLVLGTSRK